MTTEQNEQKTAKLSGFSTASLVLGAVSLASCGITSIPGLILGIISVVQIKRSRGSLTGWSQAISGIVLNAVMLIVLMLINSCMNARADSSRTVVCLSNMKQIGTAMMMYMSENEYSMPPSDKWVDLLQVYMKNEHILKCPSATEKGTSYAMNKSLSSINENRISDLPKTVLLFDSIPGDNPHGGTELLPSPERHTRTSVPDPQDSSFDPPVEDAEHYNVRVRVNNFCFADGHTKSLTNEMTRPLIWDPAKK